MLLTLLIAQATAVDADRAFAARAQATGKQWATFREWATPDGVMFVPQPVNAHAWTRTAREPAKPVRWAPERAYTSCDGAWAVTTGAWVQPGTAYRGYYTTIWQRQPKGGWKWVYDGGDTLADGPAALPARPTATRAACRRGAEDVVTDADPVTKEGRSKDGTLQWQWSYTKEGARALDVFVWNGEVMDKVVDDRVDPPKP